MIILRPLVAGDLDAVGLIEQASFVEPWSPQLFAEELAQPSRCYLAATDGDGALCGYGGLALVREDAHVVTLAVDPTVRERGVGSRIMLGLVEAARRRGACHLTLEVRESNVTAKQLYRKFGFEPVGVRKAYYKTEDALVMWATDIDSPTYQAALDEIRQEAS